MGIRAMFQPYGIEHQDSSHSDTGEVDNDNDTVASGDRFELVAKD